MARFELTDEEYELLRLHLPVEWPNRRGRPWMPHRQVLNGILWVLGAPWRDMPERYGKWQTVYDRFSRSRHKGLFDHLRQVLADDARRRDLLDLDLDLGAMDGTVARAHKAASGARKKIGQRVVTAEESRVAQGLGTSREGLSTKIHILTDGSGLPLSVTITPGQTHEATQVDALLDGVSIGGKRGRRRTRLRVIAGHKGYAGRAIARRIKKHGMRALIPQKRARSGEYPESDRPFDKVLYRWQNVVERRSGHLKEHRRVATRYEKLGVNFVAMIQLAFVLSFLKVLLSDTA